MNSKKLLMKFLSQLKSDQLKNKTCLVRVDLNIEDEKKDNFRLQAILPTLNFLLRNQAKIIILSHRGRPSGNSKFEIRNSKFSLKPFAEIFSQLLKKPVYFIENFNLMTCDVISEVGLLENLRFFPGEEKNDKKFAQSLATLGDIYINDAFAVSHRRNASVVAITQFLPSYAGLLLEKEIKNLDAVMENFQKPLVIILGGAKVSDKIGLIKNFLKKADYFLIGGAMANSFFAAQGLPIGDSLYESNINLSTYEVNRLILPEDLIIHQRKILDIGLKTIKKYSEIIKKAQTIIWNGPMGYFEDKKFVQGTAGIAAAILKNKKAKIVIGGGETATAIFNFQFTIFKKNVFISTGGGAMLEYLAGKKLPGIQALK